MFGFVWYKPLKYDTYVYPWWANLLGWMMALSSILCMPVLALAGLLLASGTLREVSSRIACTLPVINRFCIVQTYLISVM